jgi:hypothetical protein
MWLQAQEFGCSVRDCSGNNGRWGFIRVEKNTLVEVCNLHNPIFCNENIFRGDVTVETLLTMAEGKAVEELLGSPLNHSWMNSSACLVDFIPEGVLTNFEYEMNPSFQLKVGYHLNQV